MQPLDLLGRQLPPAAGGQGGPTTREASTRPAGLLLPVPSRSCRRGWRPRRRPGSRRGGSTRAGGSAWCSSTTWPRGGRRPALGCPAARCRWQGWRRACCPTPPTPGKHEALWPRGALRCHVLPRGPAWAVPHAGLGSATASAEPHAAPGHDGLALAALPWHAAGELPNARSCSAGSLARPWQCQGGGGGSAFPLPSPPPPPPPRRGPSRVTNCQQRGPEEEGGGSCRRPWHQGAMEGTGRWGAQCVRCPHADSGPGSGRAVSRGLG